MNNCKHNMKDNTEIVVLKYQGCFCDSPRFKTATNQNCGPQSDLWSACQNALSNFFLSIILRSPPDNLKPVWNDRMSTITKKDLGICAVCKRGYNFYKSYVFSSVQNSYRFSLKIRQCPREPSITRPTLVVKQIWNCSIDLQ